jgi:cytochrome c oxidase subunit 2
MMGKKLFRTVAVMALAVLCVGSAYADWAYNFQTPATPVAQDTLNVHNRFMVLIIALWLIGLVALIYSITNHRKSKGVKPATFTGPTTSAQWALNILPFVGLFLLDYVWMGVPAYHAAIDMENTKEGADLVLKVTSSQWKWQYEYPAEGIKFVSALSTTQDQIHGKAPKGENYLLEVDNPVVLPVNKKVRILLQSSDVMHSWGVPAFGVKRATVPGFLRETWVKIEKEGTYRGQCAQICGKDHAFMPIVVEAVSEEKYAAWVAKKQAENVALNASAGKVWTKEELMHEGEEIYNKICVACHQPGGKGLPGTFPALAGSKLVNAPFLNANGQLIKDGHLDRVMNGKPGTAMQAFKNTLSDVDIAAIVTYERNAFGNAMGDQVQPSQVQALR